MKRILLLVCVALLLVAGCQSGSKVTGTYAGKFVLTAEQAANPVIKKLADDMPRLDLEVRGDKTFSVKSARANLEGTWTESAGIVTLTPKTIGGVPSDTTTARPMELKMSADGRVLSPTSEASGNVTFTKTN